MLQMQASRLQPNTKASAMQSHVLEMIQHVGIATAKHLLFYGGAIRAKINPALFLDPYWRLHIKSQVLSCRCHLLPGLHTALLLALSNF